MTVRTSAIRAAAVMLLLIGVLLLAPLVIDSNKYKEPIASRVEAATGRVLSIDGAVSVNFLPLPTIKAHGARLSNLPGAVNPDMVRIEEVVIGVSLLSLFSGAVQVESIKLIRPEIDLEILPDGRSNWRFVRPGGAGDHGDSINVMGGNKESGTVQDQNRAEPRGGIKKGRDVDIHLDSVLIEDGAITFRDAVGEIQRAMAINAEAAANSLRGPFSARGTLVAHDIPLGFDVRLNDVDEDKASQIDATVTFTRLKARAHFRGLLSNLTSRLSARGKLSLEGQSITRIVAALGVVKGREIHDLPFLIKGSLVATGARMSLDDVAIHLANTDASGKFFMVFGATPEIEANVTGSKLDIDACLAEINAPKPRIVVRGPKEMAPAIISTPAPLVNFGEQRGRGKPMKFDLPANVSVSLDLDVDTVIYQGGVIRHAKASAALSGGELTFNQLSAQFPGESDVAAFGFVSAKDGKPVIDLSIDVASANLRGLLGWLDVDVSAMPPDSLRRVKISGVLTGAPDEVKVTDIKAVLDTAQLTGAATARFGIHPSFSGNFVFDNLDIDAYLPGRAAYLPGRAGELVSDDAAPAHVAPTPVKSLKPAPVISPSTPAPLRNSLAGLDFLNTFDANIRARAQTMLVGGVLLRGVTVDASLLDHVLKIRDATTSDLGGASVTLKGELSGFGGGLGIKDVAYDLRARSPFKFAQLLGVALPDDGAKLGVLAMTGVVNGSIDHLIFHSHNEVGGGEINAEGVVDLPLTAPSFKVELDASHSNYVDFVNLVAGDYRPVGRNLGGVAFKGRASGDTATGIALDDIRARLGPVLLTGGAKVDFVAGRPKLTGKFNAGDVYLDGLLPAQRAAQPVVSGTRYAENPLLHKASVRQGASPSVPQAVRDRWSREPIKFSAFEVFDADLAFDASAITWAGYQATEPKIRATLANGAFTVDSLTGKIFGGVFEGKGVLDAAATPKAVAAFAVRGANIRQALTKAANVKIAEGSLNLDTDLTASGQSMHDMVASLSGKGKLSVLEGSVQGFDLEAVNKRLGESKNLTGLIAGLQTGLNGGSTRFKTVGGTFQVANGIVRTGDLRMVADSGQALAVGSVDLPAWIIDSRIEFRIAGRPNAPPLTVHMVGSLNDPKRVIDFQGLQANVVENGAERVLKSKVGKVIREYLPPPSQDGESKLKPKDILKGILSGLGRPK